MARHTYSQQKNANLRQTELNTLGRLLIRRNDQSADTAACSLENQSLTTLIMREITDFVQFADINRNKIWEVENFRSNSRRFS